MGRSGPERPRRAWRWLRGGHALWVGLLLWCLGGTVQARVVGLVFDDSGSMGQQIQKALFAAQIVLGSLEAHDRLFVVRLNGGGGRIEEVPAARRAAYLNDMQQHWQADGGTPYEPLANMLERLVTETTPHEDAALLVFTDGEFSNAPPTDLAKDYEALRARFPGRNLQVFFVALPGKTAPVDVRRALLTAFNGAADAGATDIRKASDIVPGLKGLVAVLAGADPLDPGPFLRKDGARVSFKLPFAVRRVLLLTSGDERAAPARWVSSSFPLTQTPPVEYEPGMRVPDTGEKRRLRARLAHLEVPSPLAAGTEHRIELDRPLGPDDRVFFVSDLDLELRVLDKSGATLTPDAQGRLRVPRDQPLTVRAWLTDIAGGTLQPVDLQGSGLTPAFTLNDGLASHDMSFDAKAQRAEAKAGPYRRLGQFDLNVVARLKGLSYVRSQDLILFVDPVQSVQPTITGSPLMNCPDCGAGRVELLLGPPGPVRDLYAITAAVPAAPRPGQYRLSLDQALPEGVELVQADGRPLLDANHQAILDMAPGQSLGLLMRYDDRYRGDAPSQMTLRLAAVEEEGLRGAAALSLDLVPKIVEMRLSEDGHTRGDAPAPFVLPVTAVGNGDGIYVAAEGLRVPLTAEAVQLESLTGLPAEFSVVDDRRLLVRPVKRLWCDCLTPMGQHRVRVRYDHPDSGQTGTLDLTLEIAPVPWWERCWQELALLLALLLLLAKSLCLLRTVAFPPRAQVWRCELGVSSAPRRRDLHRRWRRVFGLTCADERRREFGLILTARDTGVGISRHSSLSASAFRTGTGECLQEVFTANPAREEVILGWNEELRDESGGYRYLLVRDRRQRQGIGCD